MRVETKDDQEHLYKEALSDFQTCLLHISSVYNGAEETKIATMKRAALAAQTRVQHRLLQQQQQQQQQVDHTTTTSTTSNSTEEVQSNGNGSTVAATDTNGGNHHYYPASNDTTTTTTTTTTTIAPFPCPSQQRRDVIQLLTANNNTFRSMQDEAYFLIDWNWWCRWCKHVDFFQQEQKESKQEEAILQLLPPGAILPEYCTKRRNDNDESSSTGSYSSKSSSSSTTTTDNDAQDEEPNTTTAPAEIDNSSLFQVNHYSNKKSTPLYTKLKPNLVRGHHYELVPREVYNALKIWYGQVTPSICRRVQVHHEIAKLPIYTDFDLNCMVSNKHQVDNHAAAANTESTLQQSVVPVKHRRRHVDAVVAFKPFIVDDRVKNPTFHFTSKFANNWHCSQKQQHKLLLLLLLQITIVEEWDCPIWEIPVL